MLEKIYVYIYIHIIYTHIVPKKHNYAHQAPINTLAHACAELSLGIVAYTSIDSFNSLRSWDVMGRSGIAGLQNIARTLDPVFSTDSSRAQHTHVP